MTPKNPWGGRPPCFLIVFGSAQVHLDNCLISVSTVFHLNEYSMNYSFKSLPYEITQISNDSVLGMKRERWHKSLSKDVYIEEALNVLSDLRFSYLEN